MAACNRAATSASDYDGHVCLVAAAGDARGAGSGGGALDAGGSVERGGASRALTTEGSPGVCGWFEPRCARACRSSARPAVQGGYGGCGQRGWVGGRPGRGCDGGWSAADRCGGGQRRVPDAGRLADGAGRWWCEGDIDCRRWCAASAAVRRRGHGTDANAGAGALPRSWRVAVRGLPAGAGYGRARERAYGEAARGGARRGDVSVPGAGGAELGSGTCVGIRAIAAEPAFASRDEADGGRRGDAECDVVRRSNRVEPCPAAGL